jgi:hypothetical protein
MRSMTLYCYQCDNWTLQHVWDSGLDRDKSHGWQQCSVCGWRFNGLTGECEPPCISSGDEKYRSQVLG